MRYYERESIVVEQYVQEVLDFSTQYGSDASISYTAHNIVGVPTKFPNYGDFSQTFVLRDYGLWWMDSPSGEVWRKPYNSPQKKAPAANNFIDVKFEKATYPFRIHIYETYNPGGIVAIWANDSSSGRWSLLWDSSHSSKAHPTPDTEQPRVFSPPLRPTTFSTRQLRIEFDQSGLVYYTEVDAVKLLGTVDPITTEAKVARFLTTISPVGRRGPIMDKIVKRGLHILPCDSEKVVEACQSQLEKETLLRFVTKQIDKHVNPPKKNNGYFDLLPDEIILKIFQFLDLVSLVSCSAVSTLFRDVSNDPVLYTVIDLRSIFYCISSSGLSWLLQRCSRLSKLDASWCGNYGRIIPSSLQGFIERIGHGVTHLRLDNCHVATHKVLESISMCCGKLEVLSLSNCHLLKPAHFQVLSQLTTLVSVNLYRTSVSQTAIITLLCNNPHIQHLSLAACPNVAADEVCLVLACCQPGLLSLDLWRCASLTSQGVAALVSCVNLKDLDLGWCLNVQASTGSVVQLIEACPGLERLYLTAHRQTNDSELVGLAKLKNLKQLDFLGNRNISFSALEDLLARVPSLRLLDVSFCEQLGDSNIRQLRISYPQVNIKWSLSEPA